TGRQEAADVAAEWILDHQVTSSSGAASDEAGAIAYNTDARDTAISDGIPDMQKDQWRRATAQALLRLAQVPLGTIGITEGTPTPRSPPPPGPPPTRPGRSPTTPTPGTRRSPTASRTCRRISGAGPPPRPCSVWPRCRWARSGSPRGPPPTRPPTHPRPPPAP